MASSQSFSMIHRRMFDLPLAGVTGEEGASVVDLGHPAAQWARLVVHLAGHVGQEEHLAVAGPGHQGVLRVPGVADQEPGVLQAGLPAHPVQIALPALPVWEDCSA